MPAGKGQARVPKHTNIRYAMAFLYYMKNPAPSTAG